MREISGQAMYIHRIKQKTKAGDYDKLLLRFSYWGAGRAHKVTLANLTWWDSSDLDWLQNALKLRRDPRYSSLRAELDRRIFSLLLARIAIQDQGKLFCAFNRAS
jgi:hypothetical protein